MDYHQNNAASGAALPSAEREKLAKIIGLLESDRAGERDAAVLAATRVLRKHGLRWCELLAAPAARPDRPEPKPEPEPDDDDPLGHDWRSIAIACAQFTHSINRWETEFLSGLPRFPRLSEKQRAILISIVKRLRARGCSV